MKQDWATSMLEESFALFEREEPKPINFMGYPLVDYVGIVQFCTAFLEVIQDEKPELIASIVKPGKDIVETIPDYFSDHDMDVLSYINKDSAAHAVKKMENYFEPKLGLKDIIKFDPQVFTQLVLLSAGEKTDVDAKFEKLLKNRDLSYPKQSDLSVGIDRKTYDLAYAALKKLSKINVSESVQTMAAWNYLSQAQKMLLMAEKIAHPSQKTEIRRIMSELEGLI